MLRSIAYTGKRYLKSLLHLPVTHRWTDPFENLLALASYSYLPGRDT
jgi:hypothetical protein